MSFTHHILKFKSYKFKMSKTLRQKMYLQNETELYQTLIVQDGVNKQFICGVNYTSPLNYC